MRKSVKGFIAGFIAACLLTITPLAAFADSIQVALNTVNINLNGIQAAAKGQSYTLDNGSVVPYSLNYNGTVYLPVRKVSELVGKDISYDGASSTIHIADKKTDAEKPASTTGPGATVKPEEEAKKPAAETPSAISTDPSKKDSSAQELTGYAVISYFPKVVNSDRVQVNQATGYLNGTKLDMLTSKAGLIDFKEEAPSLYKVKYTGSVITDLSFVTHDKEDFVKSSSQNSIVGEKGTYSISPDANIYRIYMRDGVFDYYGLMAGVESLAEGNKVYLYDVDGKGGYDVVLVNTKAK